MKEVRIAVSMLFFVLRGSVGAVGQVSVEQPASKLASPQTHVRVTGYLVQREPDFRDVLPPYPEFNSMQDEADVTTLWQGQHPDDSRWKLANTDEEMAYTGCLLLACG